jgi:hypothetical protein
MKQRIGSDLSAAVEKSCRGLLVDTCFCDDQAGCVAGGADIGDFRLLTGVTEIIEKRLIILGLV